MTRLLTTFPQTQELRKAREALDALGLGFEVIRPEPAYARVGTPCLVVGEDVRMTLAQHGRDDFLCSGWVELQRTPGAVPAEDPPSYVEDVFGTAAIMVLAPCVADPSRIRITAHLSGDLAPALPYLNSEMREGCFTPAGPTFSFMDRHRMVCLYAHRITVAKADHIVDAWRVLEGIRRRANDVWARRHEIEPTHETRERPPAIEIYRRLPRTNCKECGELTCLAFAASLWRGQTTPPRCRPIFDGRQAQLKEALLDICAGLGIAGEA